MPSSDRTHYQLAELIQCAKDLEKAQLERDLALERAARAEAEVAHLRMALWLEKNGERRSVE